MTNFDFLTDPFKRRTDKVALLGMAKTSRHLAPWDDEDYEIWCINEMPHVEHKQYDWIKRFDRSFQMHPAWDYARGNNFNDPDHFKWLTNEGGEWRKTNFPIYLLEDPPEIMREIGLWRDLLLETRAILQENIYKDSQGQNVVDLEVIKGLFNYLDQTKGVKVEIPGGVVYPLEEIINFFKPNEEHTRYFTMSFGYMMALALRMGYKEIGAYGFCMTSETEYAMQKPCGEFWMGVCVGMRVKFILPKGSPMLGQTVKLYGYDKIPGLTLMHLEISRNMLRKNFKDLTVKLERLQGEQQRIAKDMAVAGIGKGRKKKLRNLFNVNHQKEVQLLCQVNAFHGALQLQIKNIKDLKYLPTTEEIRVVMPVPAKRGE